MGVSWWRHVVIYFIFSSILLTSLGKNRMLYLSSWRPSWSSEHVIFSRNLSFLHQNSKFFPRLAKFYFLSHFRRTKHCADEGRCCLFEGLWQNGWLQNWSPAPGWPQGGHKKLPIAASSSQTAWPSQGSFLLFRSMFLGSERPVMPQSHWRYRPLPMRWSVVISEKTWNFTDLCLIGVLR